MCVKYITDIWDEIMTWCHGVIEAPTSLLLTVTCPNIMKLDWTTNSTNEDGFNIYRSLDGNNWTLLDTVGAGIVTYTDTSGFVNTLYYYRVQAFNSDETSNFSNIDSGICELEDIKYGALYNWYAATDVRNITSAGWHIPTPSEYDLLYIYLGGYLIAGGYMKEIGTTYWDSPNTGADNTSNYNGRGSGYRNYNSGTFTQLKLFSDFWTNFDAGGGYATTYRLSYNNTIFTPASLQKKYGNPIRPMKDSTTLTHGQTGIYTDPSGYIYRTICIGTQEWVADNIKTEHYRNGDPITVVTGNAAWAALITEAMCYYDNDINNA
jgi:uncharacterized protein (TIGR02145 family)